MALSTTTAGHAGAFFAQSITAHQNTNITLQSLQPASFCGPNAACSSFCACPAGSFPCNGSSANCDTGLTCDSTSNKCQCQTNCANKKCGDDANDGCGGQCQNLCSNGQAGCTSDLQCPSGSRCFIGGGPRKGLPVGQIYVCQTYVRDRILRNLGVALVAQTAAHVPVVQATAPEKLVVMTAAEIPAAPSGLIKLALGAMPSMLIILLLTTRLISPLQCLSPILQQAWQARHREALP